MLHPSWLQWLPCVCVCVCRNKERFVPRLYECILFCMCGLGKIRERSVETRAIHLFFQPLSNGLTSISIPSRVRSISDSSPRHSYTRSLKVSGRAGCSSAFAVLLSTSAVAHGCILFRLHTVCLTLHVRVRGRAFLPLSPSLCPDGNTVSYWIKTKQQQKNALIRSRGPTTGREKRVWCLDF